LCDGDILIIEYSRTPTTTAITKTIDVGFFWHDGIGDGGSGLAFHMEFLDELNDLAIENDAPPPSVEIIAIPSKLDLFTIY
jgi:hypothetical protein